MAGKVRAATRLPRKGGIGVTTLLWLPNHIVRMPCGGPTKPKLCHVAELIIAFWDGATFHPRRKVCEGALTHTPINPAVTRPTDRPLHKQMRCTSRLSFATVVLFKTKRHAKIACLMERHHGHADLARKICKDRVRSA